MNRLFVTLVIAKELRKLGFIEPCIACYDGSDMLATYSTLFEPKNYNVGGGTKTSAPLYQQVIDWLYKEYGLWITIEDYTHSEPTDKLPNGFTFYITEYGCCVFGKDKSDHTYPPQKTLELAIIECLKIIERD